MRSLLVRLWRDESGVASPEWAFIVTILVLGAITGVVASRQARLAADEEVTALRSQAR